MVEINKTPQESPVLSPQPSEEVSDMRACLEAIKELTKEVGALKAECQKWYNAGRFGSR